MSVYGYTFGRVPDALLFSDASDRAKVLYAVLTRWADLRPDEHPSRPDLARALGCSVDSTDRAKAELVYLRFLDVQPRYVDGTLIREANDWLLLPGPVTESDPLAWGSRKAAATGTSANAEPAGEGSRKAAARGSRKAAATQYRKKDLEKEKELPTAVPASAGHAGGEVIPLRSERAEQAAHGTLARLKAEVEAGHRSWSLSEAATAEWLALLDDVDTNVGPAQQFVLWYVAANADLKVGDLATIHWQRAAQSIRRWRGLVLHGVDEAITRLHPNDEDDKGRPGRAFWAYVEKVCQSTHARNQEGSAG